MKKDSTSSDDSGFFDDCEVDLDNSIQFSDNIVMVEDDAFNIIESSLEALLQEESQDKNEQSCGTLETSEEVENCEALKTSEPVDHSEPLETSTPQPERRKRGRPAKVKPVEKHLASEGSDNSELAQQTLGKKRGRPAKNNNLIKDDEELLLVEDSPVKKVKLNALPKTKNKTKPCLPDYEDLSPYEKIRADNIKEREEMLLTLGIKEAFAEYKGDIGLGIKTPAVRKQKVEQTEVEQTERRRSSRLEGKEDTDYVPDNLVESDEDPSDHTHDGLRKHPCKECVNCLRPDCRRCIFCKDKRKYGGPNIKKQKCELKEKCSQPTILCFICQGKRVFSCLACGKQFHETFQLEEHNRDVHETKQVTRRSARLTGKTNPTH